MKPMDAHLPSPSARTGSSRPFITLSGISKTFPDSSKGNDGAVEALRSISFSFPRNSFISIVGHSGCGKSTLLRIVSGLETASSGLIEIDGMSPADFSKDRPFGFVFQDAALLPWKTTLENVRLPLDILNIETPAIRDRRAREMLDLVHLNGFEDRYPAHLSGGMRQRASIARSLCYRPDVLLMDEPFGALDDFTRREMGDELLRIYAQRQATVLFVTHSLSEAVLLSDFVVVLLPRPGRVEKIIPIELERPRGSAVRSSAKFAAYVAELEALIFGEGS